ncbi:hypothetical protein CBR_g48945 [Chara braunii]|uniref:Uncharacterized protein n=1 Tax=Chara braunii TaxID=69332 RepID=A0A388M3S7_CHABU|nr:hypothetical protein CBR_g48945 [Chara braunii]|eukprot:GBG89237.1 hypothetical protein CBR_g48945 [Chara braunii]
MEPPLPTPSQEEASLAVDYVDLLITGARYGDEEDVTTALAAGVNPNSVDGLGRTALHMASANGHTNIVRILIGRNADVNAKNEELNTPLHWAALNGHKGVVEVLMEANANPAALNRYERTAVDEATQRGFQDVVNVIDLAMTLRDSQNLSLELDE